MPVLEFTTNIAVPNKKEITLKLSKLTATLLDKPESVGYLF
jgi:hypothetical protein